MIYRAGGPIWLPHIDISERMAWNDPQHVQMGVKKLFQSFD